MKRISALHLLARLHGVQTSYYDVSDRLQFARSETLLRTLQVLGVPIESEAGAPALVRERRLRLWQQRLEPVAVAWNGRLSVPLRLRNDERGRFAGSVALEDGNRETVEGTLQDLPVEKRRSVEGTAYCVRRLSVPQRLPFGYHRLVLDIGDDSAECLVISSPVAAYTRETGDARRRWGAFVPLYALHRESSWGAGDFSDLEAVMGWVSGQGGSLIATLPLLSWLSEVSDDPSPYSAASRLFWNEFYLDVARIPELSACRKAQNLLESSASRRTLDELRRDAHVDYLRQMQLKRDVLLQLSQFFFSRESERREELERFRGSHPELETFARFRAVGERQGCVWPLWPERLREGNIDPADYEQRLFEYHLYTQWQVEQQLHALTEQARERDMLWYLDFPLGVSGAGYDVWRQRDVFALGASGGAPPDAFFTRGQNWGFPPLHPERLRRQEYRYFIQSLRRHLQYARLLRFDHVMGMQRLYWVPDGFDARDGVYVRGRMDELFAILVLESHRFKAEIVGENLGTVPAAVNSALARHQIRNMFVVQYEAKPDRDPPLNPVPECSVASLNTHDMPMFASFWTALDVDDRTDLGLLNPQEAAEERERRAKLRQALAVFLRDKQLLDATSLNPQDVLQAFLAWLAASPANIVLVNLEDLWEETQPQNTPGTFRERLNWRRKLRYRFEEFRDLPQVTDALAQVNRLRAQQLERG